eukprot:TRINITY_DN23111_c0_g2_i1.p1 TRINITY_DN23111_c0_g2~~TRINITY_DN23111_c0_g2_i1.p1  ORF type:complete len:153 (+),score=29.99 TRINITY_DN23111_c0_g2_i1:91-549(+)
MCVAVDILHLPAVQQWVCLEAEHARKATSLLVQEHAAAEIGFPIVCRCYDEGQLPMVSSVVQEMMHQGLSQDDAYAGLAKLVDHGFLKAVSVLFHTRLQEVDISTRQACCSRLLEEGSLIRSTYVETSSTRRIQALCTARSLPKDICETPSA